MANLFKQLTELLSQDSPRRVGKVIAVGAHTVTIETPSGGTIIVSGVGVTVGQMVFYKDGAVVGTAPSLPTYEIEV